MNNDCVMLVLANLDAKDAGTDNFDFNTDTICFEN